MILDTLANFHHYLTLHRLLPLVSEYIHGRDLLSLEVGKHAIGHDITVIVDDYTTRTPGGRYLECHRKFIDVQIMLAGTEIIGVSPMVRCTSITDYDPIKDFEHIKGEMDFITLHENDFAIFFPRDAHLPGTTSGTIPQKVRKMVVKIPVCP